MSDQPLSRLTQDEIEAGLMEALEAEHQAEADYRAQAHACRRSGAEDLADTLETIADVERDHARRLAARITALGGSPYHHMVEPQPGGPDLRDWLEHDLRGEQWAIVAYARLVAGTLDDDATADLMTELLIDELRHARWLVTTLRA